MVLSPIATQKDCINSSYRMLGRTPRPIPGQLVLVVAVAAILNYSPKGDSRFDCSFLFSLLAFPSFYADAGCSRQKNSSVQLWSIISEQDVR